jgi:hypothetical protein
MAEFIIERMHKESNEVYKLSIEVVGGNALPNNYRASFFSVSYCKKFLGKIFLIAEAVK